MTVSRLCFEASLDLNLLPHANEVFLHSELPLEMTSCHLWIYSSLVDVNIWLRRSSWACIIVVSGRLSILFCVVLCFVYTLVDMNEKEKKGE